MPPRYAPIVCSTCSRGVHLPGVPCTLMRASDGSSAALCFCSTRLGVESTWICMQWRVLYLRLTVLCVR